MKVLVKIVVYAAVLVVGVIHYLKTSNNLFRDWLNVGIVSCKNASSYLVGQTTVQLDELDYISEDVTRKIQHGGLYEPAHCVPDTYTAIIIPFRDRMVHLFRFLNHYHPLLQRQNIAYKIFVIAQMGDDEFNRGKLMNIGYVEANKSRHWDCFVFHDVDLLLENDELKYECRENPIQFSTAIQKFGYRRAYVNNFGGVSALTGEQLMKVNGFPNLYWGWGGEDDDIAHRVMSSGYNLDAIPETLGRYTNQEHPKAQSSPTAGSMFNSWQSRWKTDGLISLTYKVLRYNEHALYTQIDVKLSETKNDMLQTTPV